MTRGGGRARRPRLRLAVGAAAAIGCLLVSQSVVSAAPASAQLCIPILLPCPKSSASPTPTPTPTDSPSPHASDAPPAAGTAPGEPYKGTPAAPDDPGASTPKTTDPSLLPADDSMVFTQPPAQLGASSLSFSGLQGIAAVKVRLADGSRVAALRLRADSITIDGFALTVRAETGPTLATTADRMTLRGDVAVYVNSLTATTADGHSYTLGADTPPPKDGIAPSLVRVTLGLVGARADQISYSNTDQRLSE